MLQFPLGSPTRVNLHVRGESPVRNEMPSRCSRCPESESVRPAESRTANRDHHLERQLRESAPQPVSAQRAAGSRRGDAGCREHIVGREAFILQESPVAKNLQDSPNEVTAGSAGRWSERLEHASAEMGHGFCPYRRQDCEDLRFGLSMNSLAVKTPKVSNACAVMAARATPAWCPLRLALPAGP